ncbi:type IIL restriction-modification enzyme MmeI, partial [Mesorhizobium sp. M0060]|uniref:type IIL restriction-modification enzyme MmeI n=1 Tax=Mesorhizobium sp. M0060 TaxID=2956866 RepID=UPI00333839B2
PPLAPHIRRTSASTADRIGGLQLMSKAIVSNHERWVINFGDCSEQKAREYRLPYDHLVATVKPKRDKLTVQVHESAFWKHWDRRDELYEKIKGKSRVLVCPEVSKHCCFAFLPPDLLFAHKVNVIPDERYGAFAALQSNVHVEWAWHNGTTMRNAGLSYTTSGCLATFPQPENLENLEGIGTQYYEFRAAIMVARNSGLTKIYDLMNDNNERSAEILELRRLQVELDELVIRQYGWNDIELAHDFYKAKQGVRYTFGEEAKRSVLRRLLQINRDRFDSEKTNAGNDHRPERTSDVAHRGPHAGQETLFDDLTRRQ